MKKSCSACGKQIPDVARHCVFCGVEQPAEAVAAEAPAAPPTEAPAASPSASPSASIEEAVVRAAEGTAPQSSSRSAVTMMGMRVEDLFRTSAPPTAEPVATSPPVAAPSPEVETDAPAAPLALDLTPMRGLPVVEQRPPLAASPFSSLVRLVMASGGLVLVVLFLLPWRGTSSWQLLETLAGADFVRQLYFLAGGVVLLANALVPVPASFRASIGALVAALPLVLGAEGLLEGWRGLVAALAVIVLPATHLLRTRPGAALDGTARALVVLSASLVGILYMAPISGVVPLLYVGRLLASMSVVQTAIGLFISIPLILAVLSLLGALGRDLSSAAVLLSVLILLWAPAAVMVFIDDGTQLYVALAILWTSTIAALCTAQLLSLAARRAQTPA